MRSKTTLGLTALLLGTALYAAPAAAQNYPTGRPSNDGGMVGEPNQNQAATPQYNGAGQVVPAPANEAAGRPVHRRASRNGNAGE